MLDRLSTQHLHDASKQKSSDLTVVLSSANVAVSSMNLAVYYYMVGSAVLAPYLAIANYVFFPLAAATSILNAIFAWHQAYLDPDEKQNTVRAVVETIGALAITTAAIGYVAFTSAFALAGPVIFAAFITAKALFQAVSAIYFGIKASNTLNHEKKAEYRTRAKDAAISACVGLLSASALLVVDVFVKPAYAVIGIVAGAFAACISILRIVDTALKPKHRRPVRRAVSDPDMDLSNRAITNNARLADALRQAHRGDSEPTFSGARTDIEMVDMNDPQDEAPYRTAPEDIEMGTMHHGQLPPAIPPITNAAAASTSSSADDEIVFRNSY